MFTKNKNKMSISQSLKVILIFTPLLFLNVLGQTDSENLSYLLMKGNYTVSQGYSPNGIHAGVDFGGTGDNVTSVYSPKSGTITDNTSACGKVAIFDGTNTIILAHMESRTSLAIGSQILAGDFVGKASKVVGGGCSATGAHLHIEIRTGNNKVMAAPANNNTATTLNPLTYLKSNLQWEFNGNSNLEGWSLFNWSAWTVIGGTLNVDPAGDDPFIVSPAISINALTNTSIRIRMAQRDVEPTAKIYFKTNSEPNFDESKVFIFYPNNDGQYRENVISTSHSKWTGTITGIRLDPTSYGKSGTNLDGFGIDYIRITQ
jgi:hypothetical protein